jgi:hypothetical protein
MPAAYSFHGELVLKSQSENITMQSKSKKYNAHSPEQIHHEPCNPSRGNRLSLMFHHPPPPARYHPAHITLPIITLPGTIELKIGRQYSKLNRVHIKSTNHSAKVLVAHLLILQIMLFLTCPILHMARRHMDTIGSKTFDPLQAWLLVPFLA